jgi:hypothetical protein
MRMEMEENPWDETPCQLANGEGYFRSPVTSTRGNTATTSSSMHDCHSLEPIRLHRSSHHFCEAHRCHIGHNIHPRTNLSSTPFAVVENGRVDFREISHPCWTLELDQKSTIVKNLYEVFSSCSCNFLTDLRDCGDVVMCNSNVQEDMEDKVNTVSNGRTSQNRAVGNMLLQRPPVKCGSVHPWNENGTSTYLQEYHITPLHHDDSIFPFDEK